MIETTLPSPSPAIPPFSPSNADPHLQLFPPLSYSLVFLPGQQRLTFAGKRLKERPTLNGWYVDDLYSHQCRKCV